jgi:hypothetical protein
MAGTTMDATIITWVTNLKNEYSGLKAHRTLAPARARYANRKMRWGGQVNLARRDQFPMANITDIANNPDQKYLFSTWGAIRVSRALLTELTL